MFKGLFGSRSHRHYARGIEHFNEGLLAEAIACFELVLDVDESGPDSALARFYRAEAHAGLGAQCLEDQDPVAALAHFDAALAENGRYPDLHIQRAIALVQRGDALLAERAARAALELNPEFIDAGALLVVALSMLADARRAAEMSSQWARIAAAKGSPLAADFLDPERLFGALIAHRRRRQERRRIVEHAESCMRDGFWSEAASALEPLVEETPDYPDLRLRLAAARMGLGELESARENLAVALRINPDFADAHVLAGIVALRLDHVRSARRHFVAAEESQRVPLAAVYGLALCSVRSGELKPALHLMNRLAGEEVPPEDARVLHAILESLAGREETARERFEAVVASTRRTEHLLDTAAWAIAQADPDAAGRALDRVEDEHRTRADVVRMQARLRLLEGAVERARHLCESALLNQPTEPGLLLDLAAILAELPDAPAGLRCLDALPDEFSTAGTVRALRAQLLRLSGNLDAARAALSGPVGAPNRAEALELLYLCRMGDDGSRARELYALYGQAGPPALEWRVQDPQRWLGPLRPWPAGATVARPRA